MIKVIALGNILMGDDGIAIYVAERLREKFKSKYLRIITGETDIDFSIDNISNGDFIFILDASYIGNTQGNINIVDMEELISNPYRDLSHHSLTLIEYIKIYEKNIKGYFIGINVQDVDFRLGLSKAMNIRLDSIVENIEHILNYYIKLNEDNVEAALL